MNLLTAGRSHLAGIIAAAVMLGPASAAQPLRDKNATAPSSKIAASLDDVGAGREAGVSKDWTAPYNHIVVLLDASHSFWIRSREKEAESVVPGDEALGLLQSYSVKAASTPALRNEGMDFYTFVAVDAHPDIVWQGTRLQLALLTAERLREILATRAEFALCTDYGAAFAEAKRAFRHRPDATNRILISLGDLINERPTTGFNACAAPSGAPPAEIHWDDFRDVTMGFYFVSTDFRLKPDRQWREGLERNGFSMKPGSILSLKQVITTGIQLEPPSKAHIKVDPESVKRIRDRLGNLFPLALKLVGGASCLGVLIFAGMPIAARIERYRRGRNSRSTREQQA